VRDGEEDDVRRRRRRRWSGLREFVGFKEEGVRARERVCVEG